VNDIGKGDWVECVRDEGCLGLIFARSIYLVDDVVEVPDGYADKGERGLLLHRVAIPPGFVAFHPKLFRPIYRPKGKELERSLLENPKARAEARMMSVIEGLATLNDFHARILERIVK
jgi:hypothetical protein